MVIIKSEYLVGCVLSTLVGYLMPNSSYCRENCDLSDLRVAAFYTVQLLNKKKKLKWRHTVAYAFDYLS